MSKPRPPNYRDAVASVTAGTMPAKAPASDSCSAYGCPLSAGLMREGKRFCCVHWDVGAWEDFPAATAVIRGRMDLVEAIALLRAPGFRLGRQVVEDACAICADLDPTLSAHKLTQQAEGMIRRLALSGSDAIYRPEVTAVAAVSSVGEQVRRLALAHRIPE